jgi:hypothetical protein
LVNAPCFALLPYVIIFIDGKFRVRGATAFFFVLSSRLPFRGRAISLLGPDFVWGLFSFPLQLAFEWVTDFRIVLALITEKFAPVGALANAALTVCVVLPNRGA